MSENYEKVIQMDGWRGTRLGYAGGRTGYMANYGNNDALRGTLGQNTYSPAAYNSANRNQSNAATTVTLLAVGAGALVFGPSLMAVGKDIKKTAQKAFDKASKQLGNITG